MSGPLVFRTGSLPMCSQGGPPDVRRILRFNSHIELDPDWHRRREHSEFRRPTCLAAGRAVPLHYPVPSGACHSNFRERTAGVLFGRLVVDTPGRADSDLVHVGDRCGHSF